MMGKTPIAPKLASRLCALRKSTASRREPVTGGPPGLYAHDAVRTWEDRVVLMTYYTRCSSQIRGSLDARISPRAGGVGA
jgi:hypothetical protein